MIRICHRPLLIIAMKISENKSYRLAIADKWLILFVLLLMVTLALFILGYFPYPYGFIILSAAILARLSGIYMMKKH
jgi:hypothetical protein